MCVLFPFTTTSATPFPAKTFLSMTSNSFEDCVLICYLATWLIFKSFLTISGCPKVRFYEQWFSMCINDICNKITVQNILYADDLKTFTVENYASDYLRALSELQKWCSMNRLLLNIAKYNYLINSEPVPRSSFGELEYFLTKNCSLLLVYKMRSIISMHLWDLYRITLNSPARML